jgi:hypothetical protein
MAIRWPGGVNARLLGGSESRAGELRGRARSRRAVVSCRRFEQGDWDRRASRSLDVWAWVPAVSHPVASAVGNARAEVGWSRCPPVALGIATTMGVSSFVTLFGVAAGVAAGSQARDPGRWGLIVFEARAALVGVDGGVSMESVATGRACRRARREQRARVEPANCGLQQTPPSRSLGRRS